VAKRIKAMGGKAIYGWRIIDDPKQSPVAILKQHHCIWESPEGELQDVTPQIEGIEGDHMIVGWPDEHIVFERDDSVPMGEKALPTRYIPRQPKWKQICHWMEIADVKLKEGDLQSCRYWTDKANQIAHKHGFHWDTPASMDWKDVFPTMLKP
jgi:hypothetical protein